MSTRAFDCRSETSPSAGGGGIALGGGIAFGPVDFPATELVVINSSPWRGGPNARVLKRTARGNHYNLPRSPESPTLQMLMRRKLVAGPTRQAKQRVLTNGEFK